MQLGDTMALSVKQSGLTLLAVMFALVFLALGSSKVVQILATQAQREREEELIRVGLAFQSAIGRYYESSPGTLKQWPRSFSDLTDDKRFITTRRYLRKTYQDPITRSANWGIVRAPDGGIQGVFSLSDQKPLKTAGLPDPISPRDANSYQAWQFVYLPSSPSPTVR